MSIPTPSPASTEPAPIVGSHECPGPAPRRRARLRSTILVGAVIAVGVAVVAVIVADPFVRTAPVKNVVNNAYPTSTATVTRQDLSSQTQVSATLGYAGSYTVVNQAHGTLTSLPSVGQVVTQGQVIYQVSGTPVILLDGSTPAYRTLSTGATGADVAELNADLVALGDATRSEIPSGTDKFTYWTEVGVDKLQAAVGETQSGALSLGQAVFAPTAVRVTSVRAALGGRAQPGQPVLQATSTTRQVSIALDAAQESEVAVGDKVTITLPDNRTTPGVISSVGTVATAPAPGSPDTSPTVTVLVDPTHPKATGTWDQAPVNVTIMTGSVSNVLVVPVDALLAQAGGGYAVEVVGADGVRRLAAVTLGLFDDADGLVQVSGSALAAGLRVVVPDL